MEINNISQFEQIPGSHRTYLHFHGDDSSLQDTLRFTHSHYGFICVKNITLHTVLDKFALDYHVCLLINRGLSGFRLNGLKVHLIRGTIECSLV